MDVEELLQIVSAEHPAGTDSSEDAEFPELKSMVESSQRQNWTVRALDDGGVDWRVVGEKARRLLARGKHLRIAIWLTIAELNVAGLTGLRDGLKLIHGLLDRHWEGLYPLLADDGNARRRLNTLLELSHPEHSTVVRMVHAAPLLHYRGIGTVRFRDVLVASGEARPVDDEQALSSAQIEAVAGNVGLEELVSVHVAADECAKMVGKIEEILHARANGEHVPDLSPLRRTMEAIRSYLAKRVEQRGGLDENVSESTCAPAVVESTATGMVRSRADVVRVLEQLCDWYESNEPSSPVPMLLTRARRMVSMSFLEIVEDLAPAGLKEAKVIRGPDGG